MTLPLLIQSDTLAILPERTIPYKTYVKRALVQALGATFAVHIDTILSDTKVTIDFPTSKASYPAVVIRFFERGIKNFGLGHIEYLTKDGGISFQNFKHYNYEGDIEFAVYALSSKDRDLIADTLVQTLAMGDLSTYTSNFVNRVYYPDPSIYPDSLMNYVNINTDIITGFGETQQPLPWRAEDGFIYQTSYRSQIYGEFYSLPPIVNISKITQVSFFPYIADLELVPAGSADPAPWIRQGPPQ